MTAYIVSSFPDTRMTQEEKEFHTITMIFFLYYDIFGIFDSKPFFPLLHDHSVAIVYT